MPRDLLKCALRVKCKTRLFVAVSLILCLYECMLFGPRSTWKYKVSNTALMSVYFIDKYVGGCEHLSLVKCHIANV